MHECSDPYCLVCNKVTQLENEISRLKQGLHLKNFPMGDLLQQADVVGLDENNKIVATCKHIPLEWDPTFEALQAKPGNYKLTPHKTASIYRLGIAIYGQVVFLYKQNWRPIKISTDDLNTVTVTLTAGKLSL